MEAKECRDCGEFIGEARVKALPHVETCIDCQRQREVSGHFKRHSIQIHTTVMGNGELESIDQEIIRGS